MFRGETWLVRLDPTEGSEIAKTRPLKVIVPITDWKDRYKNRLWMVKIGLNLESGLIKESVADTFQVRSISDTRFIQKLGKANELEMAQITEALAIVLKI